MQGKFDATPSGLSVSGPLVVRPFPAPRPIPEVPGANYVDEFLPKQGQQRLIAFIDQCSWDTTFDRRRIDFGYSYDVKSRKVGSYLGPLPPILQELGAALVEAGLVRDQPDQAIVQEYRTGQSIGSHTDLLSFGPEIASVSLGQCTRMVFTHVARPKHTQLLAPRSVLTLCGPARAEWKHGIPRRKTDPSTRAPFVRRLSVTFRAVPQQVDVVPPRSAFSFPALEVDLPRLRNSGNRKGGDVWNRNAQYKSNQGI